MKILIKNVTRLGLVLMALALIVSFSGFALAVSAQTDTETDFINILNSQRLSLNENPLSINSSLSNAAYLHSKDMAEKGYFSHTSEDGRTFSQRIVAAGYTNWTALAENIAYYYGQPDAATIYNMWKNSPGHYTNMIGNYSDAGLGVYTLNNYTYCTLDLGKNSSSVPPPAPNFSISASPSILTVAAGASTSSTITVNSVNSLNGTVGLTIGPVPTGWTVTLTRTSLAIVSGGSMSAVLAITAPSTAQTGTSTFTITGTNGSISHNATVTVNTRGLTTAPSAPRYLKATAGNAQVALTWSVPSSNGASTISKYRVYRRTATTSTTLLATTLGSILSYKDTTAVNGKTYYYTITALNSVGESPRSNEAYGTPVAPVAKILKVAVNTSSPTYSRGSYSTVGRATVIVTDGSTGKPVTGVSLTIKIYSPTGALIRTIYSTTGSTGSSLVNFNIRPYDPAGTYRIKASASKTGYQIGTGQTTYTVK
jgi:hypothetical protein